MSSDILDIVFDGRNKDYGAYDLRRNYNKRLTIALLVMGGVVLALLTGYWVNHLKAGSSTAVMEVRDDIHLESVREESKPEPIPPTPKLKPVVQTVQFTPPRIMRDEQVKEDEKPPEVDRLEDTRIGTTNQEGVPDDNAVAPPPDTKGMVETPTDPTNYEKTFTKVEVESEYPGGAAAWVRFLQRNLQYPEEAQDNEVQGQVVVKFIVDKEGKVSDVEAISGPGELRNEAVRVIKKSGVWIPGIQNGRNVSSYKSQAINFRIESQ